MAGKENLVPQSKRTKDEQRKVAQLGGVASGKARRKAKSMKEWARIFGDMPLVVNMPDGSQEDSTMDGSVVLNLYRIAQGKGPSAVKAAEALAKLRDEYSITLNVADADNRPEINIE